MQYMFLLYSDPAGWAAIPPEARGAAMQTYIDYTNDLIKAGVFVGGEQLMPASTATTLSLNDGARRVQDGPFAATKEQLGGFYIINAPDLDAAMTWAAKCPGAGHGTIEIRPLVSRGA